MAVRPGEENVATLFGDVHYFYGSPTSKPPHHRFDKGSYVYLFENANDRRARLEIANRPGTDDQDAFDGFLDKTRVTYSYKQQCLVSITVDGVPGSPPVDQSQWHLPTYDPKNENIYHYRLHSLDIYFWTQIDALQFVNAIRRVLPTSQVDVRDEPGPPAHAPRQSQDINPLVQKLENAAISGRTYGTPNPPPQGAPTFDPPPVAAVHGDLESPKNFTPMAYNPAAPAAPEQISHREKTPPPEDGGVDPLQAAVARDQAPPYTPGFGPGGPMSPMSPGFSQGPLSPGMASPNYTHLQRSVTMPVTGVASPGMLSPYSANFPGSPGFAPPPPPAPISQQPPAPSVQSPGLPPGGYSQYQYSSPAAAPQAMDYSIHQQLYRPTEAEHMVKYKPKQDGRSKLGQNADRLEKGVSGMLKKFEKKFG